MGIIFKLNCVFLLFFVLSYPIIASEKKTYLKAETIQMIKDDSPSFGDLAVYLPAMNRIVIFCQRNSRFWSLNLFHGLFLLNVNLEPYVIDEDIPEGIRRNLRRLLKRSDSLQKLFNGIRINGKMHRIALTANATLWSKRMPQLNYDLLAKTHVRSDYPSRASYLSAIENANLGTPNPTQSDECLGCLVHNEDNLSGNSNCKRLNRCQIIIRNGTNFGYWLTHRILVLLDARLSRNCVIFSAEEDERYRAELCELAYREAEYIAKNGVPTVDLFLEQIAVCALAGHAQFLRRSWLNTTLEYQKPSGCLTLSKTPVSSQPRKEDMCNDHAMAVALAAYAAATRLILDNIKRMMIAG